MTPSPTQGHEPRGLFSWNLRRPSKVPKFQIWCLCEEWLLRYKHLKNLTQCDGNGNANANANANVDDRGDYNSSPCTSYRRAKNVLTGYDQKYIRPVVSEFPKQTWNFPFSKTDLKWYLIMKITFSKLVLSCNLTNVMFNNKKAAF